MPGSLDSCINSVYEDGNIPASAGIPPVRVLLRDPFEAVISEAAAAADDPSIAALTAAMVEAAAAVDALDGTVAALGWALVNSWTYSAPVANVDFTGLAGYSELRVVIRGLTASASVARKLQVSIDNGSSFLTAGGDYITVQSAGTLTSISSINFANSTAGTAQTAEIMVSGWNLTDAKVAQQRTPNNERMVLIPTASPLNAVRVMVLSGTLTAGSIYVFAR